MKKTIMTITIILELGLTSFAAPNEGGLFQRGATEESYEMYNRGDGSLFSPGLPNHGETTDQPAPLGTGIAVLVAFGGAYLVGKRRKQD